MKRVEVID